jgi:hypothetical protein
MEERRGRRFAKFCLLICSSGHLHRGGWLGIS